MDRFIFPQWTETFKKWLAVLLLGGPVYLVALVAYGVTPEAIRIGYQPNQPVPYSHALHVGELGMDCRYCHNTVERAAHAAIPPAATCMNCHTAIFPDRDKLLPIREAFTRSDTPISWIRVNDLPDYVYFNHSAHVSRGVGCETCHGRVDQMEKVWQAKPLTMGWCLNCHNNPDPNLRDPSEATVMGWKPSATKLHGTEYRKAHNIKPPTDCSTCHR